MHLAQFYEWTLTYEFLHLFMVINDRTWNAKALDSLQSGRAVNEDPRSVHQVTCLGHRLRGIMCEKSGCIWFNVL